MLLTWARMRIGQLAVSGRDRLPVRLCESLRYRGPYQLLLLFCIV